MASLLLLLPLSSLLFNSLLTAPTRFAIASIRHTIVFPPPASLSGSPHLPQSPENTPDLSASDAELATLGSLRSQLSSNFWLSTRPDSELLRFLRSSPPGQPLIDKLRRTAAWRAQVVPSPYDLRFTFSHFFLENEDRFFPEQADLPGPFMEWLGGEERPTLDEDGSAVLIVRPRRYKPGEIPLRTWLRLITWHAERLATAAPPRSAAAAARPCQTRGAVTIMIDWRGAGVRNFDPMMLRQLLPVLAYHYPLTLQRAYVAPVNSVFQTVWQALRPLLPKGAADHFNLIGGDDWQELGEHLAPWFPTCLEPDCGGTKACALRVKQTQCEVQDIEHMVRMIGTD